MEAAFLPSDDEDDDHHNGGVSAAAQQRTTRNGYSSLPNADPELPSPSSPAATFSSPCVQPVYVPCALVLTSFADRPQPLVDGFLILSSLNIVCGRFAAQYTISYPVIPSMDDLLFIHAI